MQNGPGGARCGGCVPLDAEFRRVAGLSQCTPHFSFGLAKRETGRARSKEKKRFGGSVCAGADLLPPAGDGWRSRVEVRDGNARPLGKPPARGSTGIHPAPIFAAAGRWLMKASARTTQQLLRPPGERVAKRNARKEKLVKCGFSPRRGRHHPPRDSSWVNRRRPKRARRPGKIGACTDTPTPVARGGPLHRSALSAFFSSTGRGAFSFWARPKREWGAHPCGNSPLREQTPPARGVIPPGSPPPGAPTPPGCLPRRIPCGAARW